MLYIHFYLTTIYSSLFILSRVPCGVWLCFSLLYYFSFSFYYALVVHYARDCSCTCIYILCIHVCTSELSIGVYNIQSYMYIFVLQELVLEKETRITESMLMMGLQQWVLWTTWFIKQLLLLFISGLVMVILLKVMYGIHWGECSEPLWHAGMARMQEWLGRPASAFERPRISALHK